MSNVHRKFTKEFKVEAVRLVEHSGKSQSQVAKDLGIANTNVQRWCRQYGQHAELAFPGSGHQAPEQEEVRRLKRELEVVRMERDILKKQPCRKATPMSMKMGYTVAQREALRSHRVHWSSKPDKKAG